MREEQEELYIELHDLIARMYQATQGHKISPELYKKIEEELHTYLQAGLKPGMLGYIVENQ